MKYIDQDSLNYTCFVLETVLMGKKLPLGQSSTISVWGKETRQLLCEPLSVSPAGRHVGPLQPPAPRQPAHPCVRLQPAATALWRADPGWTLGAHQSHSVTPLLSQTQERKLR